MNGQGDSVGRIGGGELCRRSRALRRVVVLCVVACVAAVAHPHASAAPADSGAGPTESYVVRTEVADDTAMTAFVHSAAMNRTIPLKILRSPDRTTPSPTLYLLNGAGGGLDGMDWYTQTDVVSFFADKNVNVVTPVGGAYSYYTDWQHDDPRLGRNQWETFLTAELPPLVDDLLDTNGRNAIAGISMAATSVLNLAAHHQGLYRAVGSYSGCASTTDPLGRAYVKTVVSMALGANVTNMWGPDDHQDWVRNDAVVNAEKLRGTALYVSNGSGLAGASDTLDGTNPNGPGFVLLNQMVVGGAIEVATGDCTRRLKTALEQLDIPAHFELRERGTHSWGYWQDDLHDSWPMFEDALAG
ncbi:alpha/beta hydrolase family protein [Rhodococcus sp. IEGM 1401]|uniref:alpha/beta hydrolase n=1 Tax=unclassified Rhodococcus (in: high G+C Gram-positive bacteria) TaxID=192944 RepID=UPI0022B4B80E|nr:MULTISPECIES: alpha/beta hydrolase family protein [unclassified Rhodococcus (in: high G+C Gram-positive bacteria)]MCZ4561617.1 alpha/beta hydrolase family protein [Rhodococcus sp. IEGM 1401]MDI9921763.1 alpha/beta hydrolase family protein [Rhodococcus sp. IEGM 1372]MDV8034212.1 alpha/beta hydrolase family protein [Rhodococcus sp. IEGM 1414]